MSEAPATEELRYFQALEEAFIKLRGAPLLLSPADWRVAQRWRALGIPLDFAIAGMTEVFARRRERGVEERVSSLRYCARVVESGWRQAEELAAPARRAPASALDSAVRLRALAAAIPRDLPGAAAIARRVSELRGDPASIEAALVTLDDALLAAATAALDAAGTAALDRAIDRRLGAMRDRFDSEQLASAAARLRTRELRRRAHLPLLSLFSPDAESGATDADGADRGGIGGDTGRDASTDE
jgi:hypothetical protein